MIVDSMVAIAKNTGVVFLSSLTTLAPLMLCKLKEKCAFEERLKPMDTSVREPEVSKRNVRNVIN